MNRHKDLVGDELHEPYHYVQEIDPGAVGANKYWLQVSTGVVKRRNTANTGWTTVSPGSAAFISLPDVPSSYTGAAGKYLVVNTGETGLQFATLQIAPAFTILTDAATVTLACSATKAVQNSQVTLAGNRTLDITGATNGMTGTLIVIQDATGGRTLTLPAGSKVLGDGIGAITLTTTGAAIDVLAWVYNGTNYIWSKGLKGT